MSIPSSASTSPSTIRERRDLPTQSRAHPSALSVSSSAYCDASPKSTSPSTISALQVPQVPVGHACGNQIPSRRQASSTVWSARQLTSAPRGSTLTLYAVTVASPSGLRTAVALYVPRRVRPAIDPLRDRSPRRTTASCAPQRDRSRDPKRPRGAPPSTGTRRKPLLSVPESKPPNIAAGCRPTARIPADRRRRPRPGRQRESRSRITLSRSFHCPVSSACHDAHACWSGDPLYSPLSPSWMPYQASTSGMLRPPQLPWWIWCTGSQACTYFSGSRSKIHLQPSLQVWKVSPRNVLRRKQICVGSEASLNATGTWQTWQSCGSPWKKTRPPDASIRRCVLCQLMLDSSVPV